MKPTFWKPDPATHDALKKSFDAVQAGPYRGIVIREYRWTQDAYKALRTRKDLGGADLTISAAQVAFAIGYAAAKMGWDVPQFPQIGLTPVPQPFAPSKESADMTDEEYREWARDTHGLTWRGAPSRRRMEDDVAEKTEQAA